MSSAHPRRFPASSSRSLRRGDRVVAIADVSAERITIFGHGTSDHDALPETAVLDRLTAAIRAADSVDLDHTAAVHAVARYMSPERARATSERFHHHERTRRATPAEQRARTLAASIHHARRIRLDVGAVIDAAACWVMPSDAFAQYASGLRVTTVAVPSSIAGAAAARPARSEVTALTPRT
jgi:hypothetical protein